MSNFFGKTWWGQQWLNSLSNIDYENRLERGSRYARNGSVKTLKIDKNHIRAKVSGSQPKPYSVDIILPPFFDPELSEFIKALANKPTVISKLLNRELDPEVLNIADKMSMKVFPKQWSDFKMQCSCPDWAVPCKHLAAVVYKVSAEIDNNPFLVFDLHQVNLIEELEKLGVYLNKKTTPIPKLNELLFETKRKKTNSFVEENAYTMLSFSKLTPIHEALAVLLADYPAFYHENSNFKEKYILKVDNAVKYAQKFLKGKVSFEKFIHTHFSNEPLINSRTTNKITIDEKNLSKVLMNDQEFYFVDFLIQLSHINSSQKQNYQPSTASLHSIYQLSLHLLANGAIVPQIVQLPNNSFSIRWLPATISKEVKELIEQIIPCVPPDIFYWKEKTKLKNINKDTSFHLLSLFITEFINIFNQETYDDIFLNLFFKKNCYPFNKPGEAELSGGIQSWIQKYFITQGAYKPQLIIEELLNNDFQISVNIEQKNQEGLPAPISLKDILTKIDYQKNRFEILQSITPLSPFIKGLDEYIDSVGSKDIVMHAQSFTPFLMQIIPAIQLLDISILLPKSLQNILKPKPSIKLKKRSNSPSFLRIDKLLDFDWQIAIGDTLMDEKEFKKILNKSEGLIKYKANYIYVNQDDLQKLHKHLTETKELSPFQLLQIALSGEYSGSKIKITEDIQVLIKKFSNVNKIPLPKGIQAQLRPYQRRGYAWLYHNAKIGFGSVLADDMGLGKTLQTITTLLKYKEEGLLDIEKALIIAPTGLLTNWQSELNKFAPDLISSIYHGPNRKLEKGFDVLISSYGIIRSDATKLKKRKWHTLIIDEAQNIKNINTEQTKAVKSIGASNFIALSGTPVENRLSELWSIMDYSNRGMLGNLKEFAETYSNPIEIFNNVEVANKLKKVTSPFLMRRLKTDKSIISDLPDKIEMDCLSTLTKEQAGLYEKTLEEALKEIEGMSGGDNKTLFVRQGLILQMILALKQICNHPSQFLKNKILDASLSGKMKLLFNKLDSILEYGEKVLIFTQFTEMGNLLTHFIQERYNEKPLFYHGGCSMKQ